MNVGSLQLLVSFLFVGAAVARAAEPLPHSAVHTIVFFGDSLTAGYGLADPANESYPSILQRKIDDARLAWRVVNAGLSGDTTAGGVRRVDWVLRQSADIFVVALGANDGLRGVDPAVTRANLDQILARVHERNPRAKLVVAGMQMPPEMGMNFTQQFAAVFSSVAEKNHATLVPFILDGVGGRAEFNQPDRIHPTAEGHALIAETLWKTLRPLL